MAKVTKTLTRPGLDKGGAYQNPKGRSTKQFSSVVGAQNSYRAYSKGKKAAAATRKGGK